MEISKGDGYWVGGKSNQYHTGSIKASESLQPKCRTKKFRGSNMLGTSARDTKNLNKHGDTFRLEHGWKWKMIRSPLCQ